MIEHKKVYSRRSGRDGWTLKCSCGGRWHGWRWLCEERYLDHLPIPEIKPVDPRLNEDLDEFPNGEFKDEYYARQGDLRYIV